ncbi:hypothetical protein MHYP_G00086870 [Metynnis hypsauchen]
MPAFSPPGGQSSRHTIMATLRQARIPEDLARDMILNGWDEEPIGGTDSGSDISDVEDPEYCPSGHVRPSETQSAPAEQDQLGCLDYKTGATIDPFIKKGNAADWRPEGEGTGGVCQ